MNGVDRDRLVFQLPVPVTDPATVVRLASEVDRVLRTIRTAVCSGWTRPDGGDPQPHLTAWFDLDCALVLTQLEPERALLELHVGVRPPTGEPDTHPDQLCRRTAG